MTKILFIGSYTIDKNRIQIPHPDILSDIIQYFKEDITFDFIDPQFIKLDNHLDSINQLYPNIINIFKISINEYIRIHPIQDKSIIFDFSGTYYHKQLRERLKLNLYNLQNIVLIPMGCGCNTELYTLNFKGNKFLDYRELIFPFIQNLDNFNILLFESETIINDNNYLNIAYKYYDNIKKNSQNKHQLKSIYHFLIKEELDITKGYISLVISSIRSIFLDKNPIIDQIDKTNYLIYLEWIIHLSNYISNKQLIPLKNNLEKLLYDNELDGVPINFKVLFNKNKRLLSNSILFNNPSLYFKSNSNYNNYITFYLELLDHIRYNIIFPFFINPK